LNRTFTTPTSATIWTWSAWVKRGALTGTYRLFGASTTTFLTFNSSDQLNLTLNGVSAATSTAVFRDPSAWYHIVYQQNGSAQTIYVNSVSIATGTTAASIFNTAISHQIGAANTTNYFDGYLTEINFIDGQALTPSSFGETDSITGVWKPKAYSGTYGTNGFELNFSDNSNNTAATIGKDYSGNGNNWTPNNISVTAGATYDSMQDVPTLTSATAANYAVWNPINIETSTTISEGNLKFLCSSGGSYNTCTGTISVSSGKWYWELTYTGASGDGSQTGILASTRNLAGLATSAATGTWSDGYAYSSNGNKVNNGSGSAYGSTYTTGDVIGVALDLNAGTLVFYKNNTTQGTAYSSLSGSFVPSAGSFNSNYYQVNFGQRPFSYTPPTGFVALNTYNLPASTITNGAAYMAATLWTGNGTARSISNAVGSTSFQPDLVWVKSRTQTIAHRLIDSVRGAGNTLASNLTNAEFSDPQGVTSFNSGGFGLGTDTSYNQSSDTYVGWQWKANGTGASNTNGSITSTVSAGATQGFSVVTYTGTGANATVGHGLGVAPSMIIVKNRDSGAIGGAVYHTSLGATKYLKLFQTTTGSDGEAVDNTAWNGSSPTFNGNVFSVGSLNKTNSAQQMVAYCFSAVAGYSAFGSYTGNNSADGPFVYTGFRPRWILFKDSTNASTNWVLQDTSRFTYNLVAGGLLANTSASEYSSGYDVDILSNGFKIRRSGGDTNASGATIIYAAFAENPFKNSLAR
jgi:hypothetical protein